MNVCWSKTSRLSYPHIKKRSSIRAGDRTCVQGAASPHGHWQPKSTFLSFLWAKSSNTDSVEFAWIATEFISGGLTSWFFPSYRSKRACKKSAFDRPARRFAMLRSRTNLSFVSLISPSSPKLNWKFKLNWGLRGFSFLRSLYFRCRSYLAFFAQCSPVPNILTRIFSLRLHSKLSCWYV